jgi:DNA polymerase III subunit delta'
MFFRDIAGQEPIKTKLISNIRNARVSHAQLFLGPEGSGNLGLAIAYARYLCCSHQQHDDACGQCPSCVKFNKLAHPDLNFFFPIPSRKQGEKTWMSKDYAPQWRNFLEKGPYVNLNGWYNHIEIENKQGIINAEDCNEVIRVLGYKSYESEYKIVIIWMIEKLFHSAAPKLLKILEEPPPKTLFLLVSENQDLVLNTILSRAQIVNIPQLDEEDIQKGLVERYNIDARLSAEVAFLAEGNFLKALSLCKNDETQGDFTRLLRDWMRDCYSFKIKEMLAYVDALAKMGREGQKNFLNYGLEIFRKCTLLNYNATPLVKAPKESMEFIGKFSKVLSPMIAYQVCDEFSKAIYHVERNANPRILFTDLSLRIAQLFMQVKK